MSNLWLRVSSILVAGALMVSGCSASDSPDKPKELTPTEVIEKSVEAMSEKGYTYEMKLKQNTQTKVFGQQQTVNMNMDTNVDVTTHPVAMHTKGTVNANGSPIPVEIYVADNAMYNHTSQGWTTVAVDTSSLDSSDDPASGLKQLDKWIEQLGGNVLPKGVSVKKVGGSYLMEVDYAALKSDPSFDKMLKDQIAAGIQSGGGFITIDPNQIKIENYKQQIWIDAKTFKQTKQVVDTKISASDLAVDQHLEMILKGEFNGKITVPAEVKNSAKSM
ncbi:DUF6612 family protein [Thermoactinomyces sp. CICC 10521]|uniref:DUF6612 family protein n=1 Tax=Thermoactinomyces sp. CICC 10521 TaxID=2767426 RepID=UPI0018DE4A58|nr:DUF6612 family protein [Thermoactinomyces sp. CICC 10521]MBH8606348.1 hypothetical protein [Thermoactinomyces sp. CICC 10521]